jgi:hypothetical protein
LDYLILSQILKGVSNFLGKFSFNDLIITFSVIGTASSKISNNEVKSNPDLEKSKPVAGKL